MKVVEVFALLPSLLITLSRSEGTYDKNGYVMYCPCMGRFGNQVDHFLGALSFAKKLNRTLIIPPWINHDYRSGYENSFVPYNKWFQVDSLHSYHRVILMEEFMKDLAPILWPEGSKRKIYCHKISMDRSGDKKSCPVKAGNPFGPFWNNFDIDFPISDAFPNFLSYSSGRKAWDKAYPAEEHLILAFMGAPAAYPVVEADRHLQMYMEWSDEILTFSSEYIAENLTRPFVGIHLRNGRDWKRACEHVGETTLTPFMSSPQCVGYSRDIEFTKEMCFPEVKTVVKQVLELIRKTSAKSLFIATDQDSFERDFKQALTKASLDVDVVKLNYDSLVRDLSILVEADNFMGSCASSVTAFVSRKRSISWKPNNFVGMFKNNNNPKSEL